MNLIATQPNPTWTMDQLRKHFGMIPATRILLQPRPGTATEKDAYQLNEYEGHLCELVDGVLVERVRDENASSLSLWIGRWLHAYLESKAKGKLLGVRGFLRLTPGLVRSACVSFILWNRYPRGKPTVAPISPDLAVEVVGKGNTRKELSRKRRDFFTHGTRLVWQVDERKRFVEVYTSPKKPDQRLGIDDTLDGGDVLPGFKLTLRKLFSPPGSGRKR